MKRAFYGSLMLSYTLPVFACEQPSLPLIPAQEEIGIRSAEVARDTERYVEAMARYIACLRAEFRAAEEAGMTAPEVPLLTERHSGAVAELEAVLQVFDARVGPIGDADLPPAQSASLEAPEADSPLAAFDRLIDELKQVTPKRCITMEATELPVVVNDGAILFVQGKERVFLNVPATDCPGLSRSGRLLYEVRGARLRALCAANPVYVLDPLTGTRGAACDITEFYEVSRVDAQMLLNLSLAARLFSDQ